MKRIFLMVVLAVTISVSSLACKKSDQPGLSSDSNTANSPTAKPTETAAVDKDKVQSEVLAVARQYLDALIVGDKAMLERIVANDFNARSRGNVYDKDAWIGPQKGDPNVASDEISNPMLIANTADTATLHIERRISHKDGSPPYTERDSLTFVKRNGRWQLKEHITGG